LIDLASDAGLLLSKEERETEGEPTSALVGATHTHGEKHDTQPWGVGSLQRSKKFARFFDVHSNISGVRRGCMDRRGEWRGVARVLETAQHACICTYSDGSVDAMIMTTQLTTVSMHACFDE